MRVKLAVIGLATLGSVALVSGGASAMPNGLPGASDAVKNIEHVRWVCNPWGRCWWRPNYYYGGYGYYGRPRYYGRGWGYRGGWYGRRW